MNICGTTTDPEDNIASNVFTYNNWETQSAAENISNWQVKASLLPEGTNLFRIKAYDTADDVSVIVSRYFIVDTRAPAIALPQNFTTNMRFENKTNFNIRFSDANLARYLYRCGTEEYTTVTNSDSLALAFDKSGIYTLDIIARDYAGNESKVGLCFEFDISLVDLAGLSEPAKQWARKIKDPALANSVSTIKNRNNGIEVIEYMVKMTKENKGTASTILTKRDDDILIVCKHENGILGERPKKITVYDRTGRIIRQIDPGAITGTIIVWDKKDTRGEKVRDGIYFLIVEYNKTRNSMPVVIMNKIE